MRSPLGNRRGDIHFNRSRKFTKKREKKRKSHKKVKDKLTNETKLATNVTDICAKPLGPTRSTWTTSSSSSN